MVGDVVIYEEVNAAYADNIVDIFYVDNIVIHIKCYVNDVTFFIYIHFFKF